MPDDLTPRPDVLAQLDRRRQLLAELAAAAAEHIDAYACAHPGACPGQHVDEVLAGLPRTEMAALLSVAVAELGLHGYGRPPYRLTPTAYAALDTQPHQRRRWPFGGTRA